MFDTPLAIIVSLMLILAAFGLIIGLTVVFWLRRRLRALGRDLAALKTELHRQSKTMSNNQSTLANLGTELEHVAGLVGLTSVQLTDLRSAQPVQPPSVT